MSHSVVYMLEPGRFRIPRSEGEESHQAPAAVRDSLYPADVTTRLFVTHTRIEPLLGVVQPLNTGYGRTSALGFIGNGGTLTPNGLLFVNRSTWRHVLIEAARLTGVPPESLLTGGELAALTGKAGPEGVII